MSPGRAIPQFNFLEDNNSPPPIDPTEIDTSSINTEILANINDLDADIVNSLTSKQLQKLQQRKRVTFDLTPKKKALLDLTTTTKNLQFNNSNTDYIDLLNENDQLRQIIAEIEKHSNVSFK